jgi:hypothetical protein
VVWRLYRLHEKRLEPGCIFRFSCFTDRIEAWLISRFVLQCSTNEQNSFFRPYDPETDFTAAQPTAPTRGNQFGYFS